MDGESAPQAELKMEHDVFSELFHLSAGRARITSISELIYYFFGVFCEYMDSPGRNDEKYNGLFACDFLHD